MGYSNKSAHQDFLAEENKMSSIRAHLFSFYLQRRHELGNVNILKIYHIKII